MSSDKNAIIGRLEKCSRNRRKSDPEVSSLKKRTVVTEVITIENSETDLNNGNALEHLNQKVFGNELILDCIFGFLKFNDIKQFRQCCHQWGKVAIPYLKKRCVLSFKTPDYTLQRFNQVFENSQMGTHFSAVKLTNTIGNGKGSVNVKRKYIEWTSIEFTELLEDRKSNIEELTISHIDLVSEDLDCVNEFDVSQYIEPNLTKVDIGPTIPKLIISADRCMATQFLRLEHCHLKISNDVTIKPVELTLKDVTIKQMEDEKFSSLNEFVNFDRLKYLSLDRVYVAYDRNKNILSLHFRDPITVKKLDLNGCHLNLDFENANWKVTEKLSLSHVDFSNQKGIEFSNLKFEGALLDLAALPINLKKLKISNVSDTVTRVVCSNPISLPELEFFHLNVTETANCHRGRLNGLRMPWISHFKNCVNLKTIMLTFNSKGKNLHSLKSFPYCNVDIATLPKSVQNLYLFGKLELFGDDGSLHLKRSSNLSAIYAILPNLENVKRSLRSVKP